MVQPAGRSSRRGSGLLGPASLPLSPQSSDMPLRLNFTTREMGTVDLRGMSNEKREKVEFEESAE